MWGRKVENFSELENNFYGLGAVTIMNYWFTSFCVGCCKGKKMLKDVECVPKPIAPLIYLI